ncbi:MAG TPA: DUF2269 family protein [Longimicrobium sp.]|nr:DUF2269 family protein [Longimicrobium sp.]
MPIALVAEVLHVFTVFWFISGLAGRAVAQAQARRATQLPEMEAALRFSSLFDRGMVQPASLLLLGAGLVTAYLKGWPILGPLSGHRPYWVFASLSLFLTAFLLVPTVFVPRGRRFRLALDAARQQGAITPALAAALRDRVVAAAHAWEWIAVGLITILMIAKPF